MNRSWLPYVFAFSFATVFVQALIFGYNSAGMTGVFIASAAAYFPLGLIVGILWGRFSLVVSALVGVPTWLFIIALYQWSIIEALTARVESIPVVLEPISVSVFFFIGNIVGSTIFTFRMRKLKQHSE